MKHLVKFFVFHFIFLFTLLIHMEKDLKQNPRSMKWEQNGELASKDLSDLIDRLKIVENECNSSELSRLSTKSDIID